MKVFLSPLEQSDISYGVTKTDLLTSGNQEKEAKKKENLLIAYSREKTWTNGLCFYLWIISWLRSHGVKSEIVFTLDYIYYYNNIREHSSLDYQAPYQHLKKQMPEIDDKICYA